MVEPEAHQFGGVLREFAGDWTPIFADLERDYSHLTEVVSCRPTESGAELEVRTDGGERVQASISFVTPEVFRVRMWLPPEAGASAVEPPVDSPMLVGGARLSSRAEVSDDGARVLIDSGALRVGLSRTGEWSMSVTPAGERAVFEQLW